MLWALFTFNLLFSLRSVFPYPESNPGPQSGWNRCVSLLSLLQSVTVLPSFIVFHDLDTFNITRQVFYIISSQSRSVWYFLIITLQVTYFVSKTTEMTFVLLMQKIRWFMMLIGLSSVTMLTFVAWVRRSPLGFSTITYYFLTNKYIGGYFSLKN